MYNHTIKRCLVNIIVDIIILILPLFSAAQQTRGVTIAGNAGKSKTGNTYALIIGINYTGRKNFAQLHYAVNDADLLKSFLQSGDLFRFYSRR